MKYLRVIDTIGNHQDHETKFVPRIGERIMLTYGDGNGPLRDHYFRVKDVEYRFDNKPDHQVAILVEEEENPDLWPS